MSAVSRADCLAVVAGPQLVRRSRRLHRALSRLRFAGTARQVEAWWHVSCGLTLQQAAVVLGVKFQTIDRLVRAFRANCGRPPPPPAEPMHGRSRPWDPAIMDDFSPV